MGLFEMEIEPQSAHPSRVPGSIVKAICKVQSSIEKAVSQDGKNQHGNYKFASTDAIYAALTLKLAEAGLTIITLEDGPVDVVHQETPLKEKGQFIKNANGDVVTDRKPWLKCRFRFILATEQDTWDHEGSTRSLFVQITGPQTFMAAQSYAEKTFLRSLFKLPTGDLDLDAMPQEAAEDERPKRKSSAQAKRDGDQDRFNEVRGLIQAATTAEGLRHLYSEFADRECAWADFPERWAQMLEDDYAVRYEDLSAQQELV